MDPEIFWYRLSNLSDGMGNAPFGILCQFMKILLCLPHKNVDVERTFSEVSSIKTKKRNCLKVKTLLAILQTKQVVRESGGCTKFKPPLGAKHLMASSTLYNHSKSDSD